MAEEQADYPVPGNIPWFERCVHKCLACGELRYTDSTISYHLKNCPKKPRGVAKTPRETVSKPLYACLECDERVIHNRYGIGGHLMRVHQLSIGEYASKHGIRSDHVKGEEEDRKAAWYDGCEYKCNACGLVAFEKHDIVRHMRKFHKRLEAADSFQVVREGRIDCGICEQSVMQTRCKIARHLSMKHRKMSLGDYEKRCVRHQKFSEA